MPLDNLFTPQIVSAKGAFGFPRGVAKDGFSYLRRHASLRLPLFAVGCDVCVDILPYFLLESSVRIVVVGTHSTCVPEGICKRGEGTRRHVCSEGGVERCVQKQKWMLRRA